MIMEEPKDKRTKAYKEWKANQEKESQGLGDTIAKVTEATGIKKAVELIAGEDCGCDKRQKILNRLFKYNKPKCLEEDEYNYIAHWIDRGQNQLNNKQLKEMNLIYNRVFNKQFKCQKCSAPRMMKDLLNLFKQYE
jgi:hypothetical protein